MQPPSTRSTPLWKNAAAPGKPSAPAATSRQLAKGLSRSQGCYGRCPSCPASPATSARRRSPRPRWCAITYHRHQGRLGGRDDRSEMGGWVFTVASSHHWSGRGRQSTAIAEPPCPSAQEPVLHRHLAVESRQKIQNYLYGLAGLGACCVSGQAQCPLGASSAS